jgi:hypothetical protein
MASNWVPWICCVPPNQGSLIIVRQGDVRMQSIRDRTRAWPERSTEWTLEADILDWRWSTVNKAYCGVSALTVQREPSATTFCTRQGMYWRSKGLDWSGGACAPWGTLNVHVFDVLQHPYLEVFCCKFLCSRLSIGYSLRSRTRPGLFGLMEDNTSCHTGYRGSWNNTASFSPCG